MVRVVLVLLENLSPLTFALFYKADLTTSLHITIHNNSSLRRDLGSRLLTSLGYTTTVQNFSRDAEMQSCAPSISQGDD